MKYYVHIPFCHAKCAYCDFYSAARKDDALKEKFVRALDGEIDGRIGGIGDVDTLYIGGGTPSSLPAELLGHVVSGFLTGQKLREFTIEVNPEDVNPRFAHFLSTLPVMPRVSMGVQSLDDGELGVIGRRHSAADAVKAYRLLRESGVRNISLDLIYGLPGQSLESWKRSLDETIRLRPDHLSAYLLSYEPGTRLWVMLGQGKIGQADEALVEKMYGYLCRATCDAGYEHYEISNFALPEARALHNSSYWNGSEYIGLGPGAHSFVDGVRGSNRPLLKEYVDTHGCGVYVEEEEDDKSHFNDRIITSFRTSEGIDLGELKAYGESHSAALGMLADGRLVETPGGKVAIPEHMWLRSDAIMRDLIVV